jgi:hypothetical protein
MADLTNIIAGMTTPLIQAGATGQQHKTTGTALRQILAAANLREAEVIRRCAIPRWFDLGVLAVLRERDDGNEAVLRLLSVYSFVRQLDQHHYAYHDDIREVLLEDWAAQRPDELHRLNLRLKEYFERLAGPPTLATDPQPSGVQAQQNRERCVIEALYHQMRADPTAGERQLDTRLAQAELRDRPAQADALVRTEIDATQSQYELFRNAIVERDNDAWTEIYRRYRPLLLSWARQHSSRASAGSQYEDTADRALARAWAALTPERFASFPNVTALLAYLRTCVSATVIDTARAEAARDRVHQATDKPRPVDPEKAVVEESMRTELWQMLYRMTATEQERIILSESFALQYTPHTILARHPNLFADVADIYRTKRNLYERLRRSPELRHLYEEQ